MRYNQDISIVGYDDILLASYSCPPLTTIMQLKHELGVMAAQALLEHIKNKNLP
ncbi:MAG: substrate-binding domain-containing protein, partial [Desulfobacteraceae bacterium]|nr:substrate-binding domain-containing protein [Desulfobacteraceae bacterium]